MFLTQLPYHLSGTREILSSARRKQPFPSPPDAFKRLDRAPALLLRGWRWALTLLVTHANHAVHLRTRSRFTSMLMLPTRAADADRVKRPTRREDALRRRRMPADLHPSPARLHQERTVEAQ